MSLFKRPERVRAKSVSARARYLDEDAQRVDLTIVAADKDEAVVDLSLDQVRELVVELTSAYSACRPALIDQKQVDRITTMFGMR